jgi:probable rRNA maturation factor
MWCATLSSDESLKPMSNTKPEGVNLTLDLGLGTGISACPISRARVKRAIFASLATSPKLTRAGAIINLRLCDVKEAKALNRAHRGKSYAPNVLTFEYPILPRQPLQADIAICIPIVEKEAKQQGKSIDHHFVHLLVHGCLHALGFDHIDDEEAQRMEDQERSILKRFRIPDPYAA